jgi:hypothetical protein
VDYEVAEELDPAHLDRGVFVGGEAVYHTPIVPDPPATPLDELALRAEREVP